MLGYILLQKYIIHEDPVYGRQGGSAWPMCRLMRAVPVPTTAMAAFTVKTLRKGRGDRFDSEVNRKDHDISILIALEPCSLIPIAIQPSAHNDHFIGEISCVQSDLDRSHGVSLHVYYPS